MTAEHKAPVHVGIIMDGNGRWAQKRGLPRTAGHKEGLEAAKKIVAKASELGIKYVTLYTFSTENWKRTQEEVGFLMNLIRLHLRAEFAFYKKNSIRVKVLGDLLGLPEDVRFEIEKAEAETQDFTGLTVILAINYGGRDEICHSVKTLAEKVKLGELEPEDITEEMIERNLYTEEMPPLDLVIRPSGEQRLSNFMIWQAAYAEFYYTNILWPDFRNDDFDRAIMDFCERNRRFGGV